ncbi:MAG: replication restart helicase PriA [Armatimonadota bacterium]
MFALVLPDIHQAATDRLYTYRIPPRFLKEVVVGGSVSVPLGSRVVSGVVLALSDTCDTPEEQLRALIGVRSSEPAFTPEQAQLARWLAETYLCPLTEALRLCMADTGPAGKRCWRCADIQAVTTLLPDPTLSAVLQFIHAHPGASSAGVRARFGEQGAAALDALRRDGHILPARQAKSGACEIQAVLPALPPEELLHQAEAIAKRAPKQADLLRWMAEHADEAHTTAELARLLEIGEAVIRTCIAKGWLRQEQRAVRRNPWESIEGRNLKPPQLNPPQQASVETLCAAIAKSGDRHGCRSTTTGVPHTTGHPNAMTLTDSNLNAKSGDRHGCPQTTGHPSQSPVFAEPSSFLLYGVTGSGKTEVFLHAIEETLAQGRQAIVLVPEISLTAQAMALYHGRFPEKVAVLHSHLSIGERYDEWQRIAHGEAQVVLGARSAIFAPCPDVGLIIIDEEHESSYKQENSPRYHAKAVALQRGRLCNAPVVLASATPSLETMREVELGMHRLLNLPERIESRPLPTVKIVDLRRMTSGARILSAPLRQAITARLAAKEQTILFLNRRGYSHALLCTACGNQEGCPHCSVPLTYHLRAELLRCHHCDFSRRPAPACPQCGGTQIAYKGVGTERLEKEVAELWPEARLGRLDRDTTARKGAHHAIIGRFSREETDILIGTQMVAKGFDFPKVTLVGVIAADTSLSFPDFRAPERTFQLLTQVAGRAGRSDWPGEVIVQTFQPEHYAIRAAMTHDYDTFYTQEIVARGDAEACWPPLTALINILVTGPNESQVKATAAALARRAREEAEGGLALPRLPETPALPGLLDLIRVEESPEEEEEDPFGAEALLQREVPGGVIVDGPAPCPLAQLRGRYRYHLVLRGQDPATLRRVARHLLRLTPPHGVQVTADVDPLAMA